MTKATKYLIVFLGCLMGIVAIIIIPKKANVVGNAAVNENNGDIAFCFLDMSNPIPMLQVNLFDKNGELLFEKNLYSEGGTHADFLFDGELLVVCVGRIHAAYYCFDRTGAEATSNVTIDELEKMTGTFIGWEKSIAKKSLSLNGTVYLYEAPAIFRDRARLSIKSGNFEKTLYESP
ncbi:MAG: hypothetical protein IKA67_01915 [Clostridia bacterium]|nr:hypothetical protein [Clostridia bacterium]